MLKVAKTSGRSELKKSPSGASAADLPPCANIVHRWICFGRTWADCRGEDHGRAKWKSAFVTPPALPSGPSVCGPAKAGNGCASRAVPSRRPLFCEGATGRDRPAADRSREGRCPSRDLHMLRGLQAEHPAVVTEAFFRSIEVTRCQEVL